MAEIAVSNSRAECVDGQSSDRQNQQDLNRSVQDAGQKQSADASVWNKQPGDANATNVSLTGTNNLYQDSTMPSQIAHMFNGGTQQQNELQAAGTMLGDVSKVVSDVSALVGTGPMDAADQKLAKSTVAFAESALNLVDNYLQDFLNQSKDVPAPTTPTDGGTKTPTTPTDGGTKTPTTPTDGGTKTPTTPTDGGTKTPTTPTDGGTTTPTTPTDGGTKTPTTPTDGGTKTPTTPTDGGTTTPTTPTDGGTKTPTTPTDGGTTTPTTPTDGGTKTPTTPTDGGTTKIPPVTDGTNGANRPVPGQPAQPGDWIQKNINGMNYDVLLPSNYDPSKQYPTLLYLHQLDMGTDEAGLKNEVNPWLNSSQFRSDYPAIVVMPLLDQSADPSGQTINFGGVTPGDQPGQDNAIAALKQTMADYSSDPSRVYVTGNSLGGIGTWDMLAKYNSQTGTDGKIFAAGMPLAGADYALGYDHPDPSVVQALQNVPIWSIHGANDTQVPLGWDQAMASQLANDPNFHYTEVAGDGHDVWDDHYGLPEGQQYWDWLFSQASGQSAQSAVA